MKKLTTKWFRKWSKRVKLSDESLLGAIDNLESGMSVSDLGGNLYKVRVKRQHGGKSSGFRTIVVYRVGEIAIFLYGFGKNERDNIGKSELKNLKKLGNDLISLTSTELDLAISKGVLFELEDTQ